jgi:hypothetical protein
MQVAAAHHGTDAVFLNVRINLLPKKEAFCNNILDLNVFKYQANCFPLKRILLRILRRKILNAAIVWHQD